VRPGPFALVAVAALVSIALSARAEAPSQDAAAAALLAKHRAFVGWQFGDGTFRSMRITGDVTNEKGETTESFVMLSEGLLYRNTYTLLRRGDLTQYSGFTGSIFWNSDINGFTTPVYGDLAKYRASFTVLEQEGTTELPATFVEDKTIDGKTVGVVRVTMTNGDPIDLDVDPATGAYVQATIDPGRSYHTTIHILSYADVVPGKKMISSYRLDEDTSVDTYRTFEPNAPVSDNELHPPTPTASWNFGDQQFFPISLTRTRILLEATVNGRKGRFILDTGASAIVLDDRFADLAQAPSLKGKSEASTLYGAVPTRVRHVDTIAFGNAALHNVYVYSEDFAASDYRGLDRAGYDGLIGYDLFAGAIVKLNVYESQMAILDPASDLSSARGLPMLVDLSEGIPAIPMTLNKSIEVNAYLDTGNPGIIFFGPDLVRKHHLKIMGCGNIESLAIGPITYESQMACEWGMAGSNMLLGYDFLKHFDFIFDYPHGRIILTTNKN